MPPLLESASWNDGTRNCFGGFGVEVVDACLAWRGRRRHIVYKVELWAAGCYMWTVERRYRSFLQLHKTYCSSVSLAPAPPFPGSARLCSGAVSGRRIFRKIVLGRFDPELIEERRKGLHVYLSEMICAQARKGSVLPSCLWDFLGWGDGLPAPEYSPRSAHPAPECCPELAEVADFADRSTSASAGAEDSSYKTLPSLRNGSSHRSSALAGSWDKVPLVRKGSNLSRLSSNSDLATVRLWPEEDCLENEPEALVCLSKVSNSV